MRITDQQLTLRSDYQQQQQQVRQQTILANQPLPVSELRASSELTRYRETGADASLMTGSSTTSTDATADTNNNAPATATLLDNADALLTRRELMRQARNRANQAATHQQPEAGTGQNTVAPDHAEDGKLAFMQQASSWLSRLSANAASSSSPDAATTGTTASNASQEDTGTQDELSLDSQTRIMKSLLEKIFGITIKLDKVATRQSSASDSSPSASNTPSAAGSARSAANTANAAQPDQAVLVSEASQQQEALTFSAQGQVTTSDGRQIALKLGFALQFEQTRWRERLTRTSALKDPLVLNLDGQVAGFSSARFQFDLDADGQKESLPELASGAAFLARDSNGNGQIDDGNELFGARSGNGFADLATLDTDGNGVLDEADSSFATLRLYRPGEGLLTLGDRQIGAIFLQNASTPFQHLGGVDSSGQSPAVLRQTGLYLKENGEAGTLQQVDLRV